MKKFLVALSLVTLTSSVFGMNSQRFAREIDSQVNSRVPLRKNTNLITDNDLLEHLVYNAFYGGNVKESAQMLAEFLSFTVPNMYEQAAEKIKSLIYSAAVKLKTDVNFIQSVKDSVYDGDISALEKLLKNQTTIDINSVLIMAIDAEQLGALKCAIEYGADVNFKWSDRTPLFMAVLKNNHELVKYLLSKGAKVDVRTSSGYTPLFLAFKYKYMPIFIDLMAYVPREEQKKVRQELKSDILREFPDLESVFQGTIKEADVDDLVNSL